MQCDWLTGKRYANLRFQGQKREKKNLLGQSPLSWGCNSTASCAKEKIPGSQLMPSCSQSASCLAASALSLQMNSSSHSLPSERREFITFFLCYWFISAGEGTYTPAPTENVPLSISRTNLFLPVAGVTQKSQTSVWNAIKVMIWKFYIVFCINDIKIFCSCTCLLFTLA